jgi:hypothetical protein
MKSGILHTAFLCAVGTLMTGALLAQQPGRSDATSENTLLDSSPPDRVIYVPQLPSVDQLTQAAAAQGVRVEQAAADRDEVSISYRLSDDTFRTIAYRLLTNSPAPAAPVVRDVVTAPAPPPQTVRVVEYVAPPPRVVYRYRSYDPFWDDPFYWSRPAPVSVHLGFGWHSGSRHHFPHHHGSHRHHRRW